MPLLGVGSKLRYIRAKRLYSFPGRIRITIKASSLFGVGGNDRSCLSTDVFRFG
jgi:hypothetical protein